MEVQGNALGAQLSTGLGSAMNAGELLLTYGA